MAINFDFENKFNKQNKLTLAIAGAGVLVFILSASFLPFKDTLFNLLFPKPPSHAAVGDALEVTNPSGSPLSQPTPGTYNTDSLDVVVKVKDINALLPVVTPSPLPTSGQATPTPIATATPAPILNYKRVFVTSQGYFGGDIGGLLGADQKCMAKASAANLTGTYKAWLSSSTISASSRLTHSTIPYKSVDGIVTFANNWTDLTDGTIASPINKTETGGTVTSTSIWTNTTTTGGVRVASYGSVCNDWSFNKDSPTGLVLGLSGSGSSQWTASGASNPSCLKAWQLYCFEQ